MTSRKKAGLAERQRQMRAREADKPRTGRPRGKRPDLGVSMSEVRFCLANLLERRFSVEASVRAVNRAFGVSVVEDVVRKWRASGYDEWG
jgi:hypothetical protein